MPAVPKKLASIFSSSPCSSPKLDPEKPKGSVPPLSKLARPRGSGPAVDRVGMPCASQLFNLFQLLAGDSSTSDLSMGGDVDSDEDEHTAMKAGDDSDKDSASSTLDDTDAATVKARRSPVNSSSASHSPVQANTDTPAEHDAKVQHWIDETIRNSERDRDALSSRFTALSLSNLSSAMPNHPQKPAKKRPALPHTFTEQSPEMDDVSPDATSPTDSESFEAQMPPIALGDPLPARTADEAVPAAAVNRAGMGVDDISDEEKLAAIADEFGPIAELFEGDEPERILAESKGSLFRSVMMVGNLHLTTHRLLFHASLPPESAALESSPMSGDTVADAISIATAHQPDVLHAGPITVHRPGTLKPAKRVWMELSSEMVTTFPSADEAGRVRPLRCILLSSVKWVEPYDPLHPCDFYITYDTPSGLHKSHFTVDTEQSASQWRRAFDAAVFRQNRYKWRQNNALGVADDWSVMRVCIPLDRVTLKGISRFHSFATLVGLDIELDQVSHAVNSLPGGLPSGDWAGEDAHVAPKMHRAGSMDIRGRMSPKRALSRSRRPESPASPSPLGKPEGLRGAPWEITSPMDPLNNEIPPITNETFTFNIAVLNEQAWFAEAVQAAVGASAERKYKAGVPKAKMVLEVGGHDCLATDEELERKSSEGAASTESEDGDDDEDGQAGLLHATRKEQKAALAAKTFALREDEGIWIKRCYVSTTFLPARGHIILTPRYICFWRRVTVGSDIKDIKGAVVAPGLRARFHGMALQIHGHRDLQFEFWNRDARDEVLSRVNTICKPTSRDSSIMSEAPPASQFEPSITSLSHVASPEPTLSDRHPADILMPPRDLTPYQVELDDDALPYLPFVANKPWGASQRLKPRTFAMLTIGSRGDVQPYIALGLRLKKDGHKVVIVTHAEFKGWVEGYGIEHRQAGVLLDSWTACHDADVLIESPSAMAGIHIAEALKIPYFRAFTMPWTRTNAYPHAFLVPAFEMGPSFNYSTYVLFDNIMWKATAGQINRWRKQHLNLKSTDMATLSVTKVPFLYNFSPAVVPKPLDWHDDIIITGYWNLEDSDTDWSPSPELEAFMYRAKVDDRPLVYIGFGSIVVPRPNAMTKSIIKAVEKANVRAIIAKGWSSRGGDPAKEGENIEFPDSCFGVDKIPHAWLFPRVQAALHHGGAGTVGASLRAGIPTLIKPWFGDQFFWSIRVTRLGVGLKVPSLRSDDIASALVKATTDRVMIEKAARIGERIRAENGVEKAVQAIQHNITRAASDRRKMHWAK
ncbi:hypothetical protein IAT38_004242 [Cryptococcus sp. DSM 104549]